MESYWEMRERLKRRQENRKAFRRNAFEALWMLAISVAGVWVFVKTMWFLAYVFRD